MSVQFEEMIFARQLSEIGPAKGPVVDRDYIREFAQAHVCSSSSTDQGRVKRLSIITSFTIA